MITVLRDKFVPAWPRRLQCAPRERGYAMLAGVALERSYKCDAHFACYHSSVARRLSLDALDHGVAIELTHIAFDLDGPNHTASLEWRRETREKVQALAAEHPNPFYYETRGGARFVYRQAEPTVIRTQDDAKEWRREYSVAIAYLARRFGIEADPACSDCTRLFRLPRATRDFGGKPENHPEWGDPHVLGALEIAPSHEDIDAARAASKAWRDYSRKLDLSAPGRVDDGLLYWLLKNRGDVGGSAPRGGWICHCPNRAAHSTKTDGTDSTVVYPPKDGKEIGVIVCKHGHCENFVLADWLRFFSDSELDAARKAAGIRRAA